MISTGNVVHIPVGIFKDRHDQGAEDLNFLRIIPLEQGFTDPGHAGNFRVRDLIIRLLGEKLICRA